MKCYIIRNKQGDYWNNEEGWMETDDLMSLFTITEKNIFNLPIGGHWEEV